MPGIELIRLPVGISSAAQFAAASYLTRYEGNTLRDYSGSLDLYFRWLMRRGVDPLEAKRPHLELFMRQHLIEERRNKPATVAHRMLTIGGFYRFAVLDDLMLKDPSVTIRIPRIWTDRYREDYLTRDELRAIVATAKRSDRPSDHGLIALLALLGLRIAEVLAVQIEDFTGTKDGHRVLLLVGKGGKPATVPLPMQVVRMLETATRGHASGPLLIRDRSSVHALVGLPLTYRAATIAIERLAWDAGIRRHVTPHMFRRGYVTGGLDAGISLRDMQIAARHSDPRTTTLYDRGQLNLDRHANHIISATIAGAA
jgi:site-specific recombinase XerD